MPESTLIIDVDARKAISQIEKIQDEMLKTQRRGTQLGDSFRRLSGLIKSGIGAIAGGATLGGLISVTDQFKNLESQLRLVTDSEDDLIVTGGKLAKVAGDTNTAYASTVKLYARLSRATKDLDVSEEDLLVTTEAVNNAFLVSGASAEESSGSITQFTQALAAGALRGDEFNSVAEQAPRLLQAISDYTGRTTAALREMSRQGEITSDIIINSLVAAQQQLREEAEQVAPTISREWGKVGDQFFRLVGLLDQAADGTSTFATVLSEASSIIGDLNGVLSLTRRLQASIPDLPGFDELKEKAKGYEVQLANINKELDRLRDQGSDPNSVLFAATTKNAEALRKALDETNKEIVELIQNGGKIEEKADGPAQFPKGRVELFAAGFAGRVIPTEKEQAKFDANAAREQAKAEREQAKAARELAKAERARADEFYRLEDAKNEAVENDERIKAANDALLQSYLDSINPMNEYHQQLAEIDRLMELYPKFADQLLAAQYEIDAAMEKSTETTKKRADETKKFYDELGAQAEDQLGDTIFGFLEGDAGDSFENILKSWESMLNRMVSEALAKNIAGLFGDDSGSGGTSGGGFGSLFSSLASGLFGGARADGGPVEAGRMYKINEDTPRSEYFMPKVPGAVIPAAAAGGGGTTVVNMNISGVQDVGSFARDEDQVLNRLQRKLGKAGRNN